MSTSYTLESLPLLTSTQGRCGCGCGCGCDDDEFLSRSVAVVLPSANEAELDTVDEATRPELA